MSFKELEKLPILMRLKEDVLQAVFDQGKLMRIAAQTTLFCEGEAADSIFWIISGRVKTSVLVQEDEVVINILSRGGKLGLVELCEEAEYSVSALAIEETVVFCLSKSDFQKLLGQHFDFQRAVFANLSAEMRGAVKEINDLKLKNTSKRLGTYILGMVEQQSGTAVIDLPFDKRLLAARLAMKPESLSRALAKLKPVGVSTDKNRITINDMLVLRAFCGEESDE